MYVGLTNRFSTTIEINPPYPQANALRTWYCNQYIIGRICAWTYTRTNFEMLTYLKGPTKWTNAYCVHNEEHRSNMLSFICSFRRRDSTDCRNPTAKSSKCTKYSYMHCYKFLPLFSNNKKLICGIIVFSRVKYSTYMLKSHYKMRTNDFVS